jgi:hypothetical protein
LSFFCFTFSGIIFSTSKVLTFTTSSNMDTALGMASTPHNNTEDLVESSPSGTQAAPVDDDSNWWYTTSYRREKLQEAQEQRW